MNRAWLIVTFFAVACSQAFATELNLEITSHFLSTITVEPGSTVDYTVTGVLDNDINNEGLAAFVLDLHFSGGPLSPANTPTGDPMIRFVSPAGVNNPAGYGGTQIGGALIQIGGMQNVINNVVDNAPAPIGTVLTGVGHTPVILVTGSLAVPVVEGGYTLNLSNLIAAVIKEGETGTPVWAIEQADAGLVDNLTIIVSQNPPTGACCQPPGLCLDNVTPAQCADPGGGLPGGIYRGDGTTCGGTCVEDLDCNGEVRVPDLIILLSAWGPNPGHPADFDGDGEVRVPDLIELLVQWGACP